MKSLFFYLYVSFILISCNKNETLVDIDGNNYETVQFDKTFWMSENLKVKRPKNGDEIKFYYPNDDERNVDVYGQLYN